MQDQNSKNLTEAILDSHKEVVDTVVENTKKLTGGNNAISETIEKGSEWYKNWLETQKDLFKKTSQKTAATAETVKENTSKVTDFYENWFNMQTNMTKQMWEMNQEWFKNISNNGSANTNPMNAFKDQMSNWMNQMTAQNWMNQMQQNNPFATWMNQAQQNNPFSTDSWKKANENWTGFFNQYTNLLNNNFTNWQKNFESTTAQDAYKNMTNTTEGFMKFAEMWSPMLKSIQDKTFNMDVYKQWMNPEMYKELMDKYFGFMPESSRDQFKQMSSFMQDSMKQMNGMGGQNYKHFQQMMNNNGFNPSETFGSMMSAYSNWQNMMDQATAPFTKLMTPNEHTRSMQVWKDITNRMMVYNIKNSELQYMIYTQGNKVMDKLAETMTKNIEEGKEVASMLAMYQEWLNISDKVFVSLFESDEYSKLMAEVSAMQMTLRKDIENQMEKYMKDIPVATRSEMDEIYKTVHELKSKIRQMEKMMELDTDVEETTEEKPAKKTAAKKA